MGCFRYLKWDYHDENTSFLSKPFQNINKYEKKNAVYFFQIFLFVLGDIEVFLNMQIVQAITSYAQPNFDQIHV